MSSEHMHFKAEVSRLLDIVVHSLYSDKEVFLRELISNAADACDKLRYEALTRPELLGDDPEFKISISIDKKARTITVTDNGIGMTRDELVENLGTIARSGTAAFLEQIKDKSKAEISQIGQFGVGFYAAFMVAQAVEVNSRKAGSEESWSWESDGRGEFTIEGGDKSDRGTEVVVYLKQGEDAYLDVDRVRGIIAKYSDHVAIPVYVDGDDTPANKANALWLRPKSEVTPEQYTEFYHYVGHAYDDPAMTTHWRAEGVIEYTGLLFVPSQRPFDLFDPKRAHGVKLYVKRVFITDQAEGLVPPWLRFLRGVVDSEDLPLNVSREMLQNNLMLAKIRQGLTKRVLADLTKIATDDPHAYAKIWENFGAVLKEGLYEDIENRPELSKLVRCASTESDGLVSLSDYVSRMKEGQNTIFYICGESAEKLKRNPHLEGFKSKGVEVLLLTETVDDFWPGALGEFEGKVFKSVTRSGEDLAKIAVADKEKEPKAPDSEDKKDLLALIKLTLGDSVKDVRLSDRLTSSPVCLTADEGDLDIHLERFLKQHNQIRTPSKRILEINPKHALIEQMAKKVKVSGATNEDIKDVAWLLFDQARLLDGDTLSDPVAFSERLGAVLKKAVSA